MTICRTALRKWTNATGPGLLSDVFPSKNDADSPADFGGRSRYSYGVASDKSLLLTKRTDPINCPRSIKQECIPCIHLR